MKTSNLSLLCGIVVALMLIQTPNVFGQVGVDVDVDIDVHVSLNLELLLPDCPIWWFEEIILNGVVYVRTTSVSTWAVAKLRCETCFLNAHLLNVNNSLAVAMLGMRPEMIVWIGSYDGGDVVANLAWWGHAGAIAVMGEGALVKGLCGATVGPSVPPVPLPQIPSININTPLPPLNIPSVSIQTPLPKVQVPSVSIQTPTNPTTKTPAKTPTAGNPNPVPPTPMGNPNTQTPTAGNPNPNTQTPTAGNPNPNTQTPTAGNPNPNTQTPTAGNPNPNTQTPTAGNPNPNPATPTVGNPNPNPNPPPVPQPCPVLPPVVVPPLPVLSPVTLPPVTVPDVNLGLCDYKEELTVQGSVRVGSTIAFAHVSFAAQWCSACIGSPLALLNLSLSIDVDVNASGEYYVTALTPAYRAFILDAENDTTPVTPLNIDYDTTPYKALCEAPEDIVEVDYSCADFVNFTLGPNVSFVTPGSLLSVANWSLANETCNRCFGTGLALISSELVNYRLGVIYNAEYYIGAYDFLNATVTANLVWSTTYDTLYIADDDTPRRFLCESFFVDGGVIIDPL